MSLAEEQIGPPDAAGSPTQSDNRRTKIAKANIAKSDDSEQATAGAISLSAIKDGGAQMRVEMRPDAVNEYAQEMLGGAEFPPVIVYRDGDDYWLADGFHRVEAARKAERETIKAEVHDGTARDAILHGIGANASHGLRRTNADKRRAVERLLTDPDWAKWSNRKIAQVARVDHKTVGTIRRELSGEIPTTTGKGMPTTTGKPNASGSLIEDLIRTISDDVLIAECRRRNLEVADA